MSERQDNSAVILAKYSGENKHAVALVWKWVTKERLKVAQISEIF